MINNTKTLIGIQARLTSTRWPGKVIEPINGDPILLRVCKACQDSGIGWQVLMPYNEQNAPLSKFCNDNKIGYMGFPCDENDLIGRYIEFCEYHNLDGVLRVTADCPYIFPQEIQWIQYMAMVSEADFVTNGYPVGRTTPDGVDCEYYSHRLLSWMHKSIKDPRYREHVPLYWYEHSIKEAGFVGIRADWPVNLSGIKFSIDSPADVDRMRKDGLIE